MNLEKTIQNLELRGFRVTHFADPEAAAAYLDREIDGGTVGFGGSRTLEALGVYERLAKHNRVFWHWKTDPKEARAEAMQADVYLSSANAISEDGEILNIDGSGNRVAGTLFGHRKVYIVAGTNKLCPDFDSALSRARNTAAVTNCKRFPNKPPCQIDDKCHDCRSPERICRALVVQWMPMMDMESEIVLIDEDLGY